MSIGLNESNNENRVIAILGWGCAVLCVLLGLPIAILASVGAFAIQRSQPPEVGVVRNERDHVPEVEITNPSPVSRRVTEIRFVYEQKLPPENLIGAITLEKVIFEQSEYDKTTKTFRKVLNGVEMPAFGNLNMQFFVRNPRNKGYRLFGRLEIYYDDRKEPNNRVIDNYPVVCID